MNASPPIASTDDDALLRAAEALAGLLGDPLPGRSALDRKRAGAAP